MEINKYLFIIIASVFFLSSCGGRKKTISNQKKNTIKEKKDNKDSTNVANVVEVKTENKTEVVEIPVVRVNLKTKDYILKYAEIAMDKMRQHKIPASITLAQGILESASGNSKLTQISNNHFGIKCHKGWEGEKVFWDDDAKDECFRKYEKAAHSFEDHSQFLLTRGRYSSLFQLNTGDYVGWAYGLKAAGYATDKNYPQKLIGLIEAYKLYEYDEMVMGKIATLTVVESSDVYVVKAGEGLFSIAKQFDMTVDELKSLNNLKENTINKGQQLKVKSANKVRVVETSNGKEEKTIKIELKNQNIIHHIPETHTVQVGETLFAIAKKYNHSVEGIKSINQLTSNDIMIGQVLKLKSSDVNNFEIQKVSDIIHRVQKGETLFSIAKLYHVTITELMQWNLLENNEIFVGQNLFIKQSTDKQEGKIVEPKKIIPSDVQIESKNIEKHVVQKGDTLFQIALLYGIDVSSIKNINHLTSDELNVGQTLILKENKEVVAKTHTVVAGDTLFSIAKQYNLSVEKLNQLNNIQNNIISIGQVLKLE